MNLGFKLHVQVILKINFLVFLRESQSQSSCLFTGNNENIIKKSLVKIAKFFF